MRIIGGALGSITEMVELFSSNIEAKGGVICCKGGRYASEEIFSRIRY